MWITPDQILCVGFVAALIFVGLRAYTIGAPLNSTVPGLGKFDIKSSWISNTTLFGAVLAAALKDKFPGEASTVSELIGLNVLFAGLAITPVLIYMGSVRPASAYDSSLWAYSCPPLSPCGR